jgi:hypothetical protein
MLLQQCQCLTWQGLSTAPLCCSWPQLALLCAERLSPVLPLTQLWLLLRCVGTALKLQLLAAAAAAASLLLLTLRSSGTSGDAFSLMVKDALVCRTAATGHVSSSSSSRAHQQCVKQQSRKKGTPPVGSMQDDAADGWQRALQPVAWQQGTAPLTVNHAHRERA